MYQGAGYSSRKGVINIEVDNDAPPPPAMTDEECESHVVGLCMATMYNLRKGAELFGDKADKSVMKDLVEIDEFETYQLIHNNDLSREDRDRALESMMKITNKGIDAETSERKIKGRQVEDSSNQRSYDGYEKSNGSSLTARTDIVIMTGVIDAHQRNAIAVIDVQNTFLQSKNDQRIITYGYTR